MYVVSSTALWDDEAHKYSRSLKRRCRLVYFAQRQMHRDRNDYKIVVFKRYDQNKLCLPMCAAGA